MQLLKQILRRRQVKQHGPSSLYSIDVQWVSAETIFKAPGAIDYSKIQLVCNWVNVITKIEHSNPLVDNWELIERWNTLRDLCQIFSTKLNLLQIKTMNFSQKYTSVFDHKFFNILSSVCLINIDVILNNIERIFSHYFPNVHVSSWPLVQWKYTKGI